MKVLSAKHGLIDAADEVDWYDERLVPSETHRVAELARPGIVTLMQRRYSSVFIFAGATYLTVLEGILAAAPPEALVHVAKGPPGVRSAALATWLRGVRSPSFGCQRAVEKKICGVPLVVTYSELLDLARVHLRHQPAAAFRFHSWCVSIDGVKVSPKWLVSIATGLQVSRFSTYSACRALARLGYQVESADAG